MKAALQNREFNISAFSDEYRRVKYIPKTKRTPYDKRVVKIGEDISAKAKKGYELPIFITIPIL